MYDGKRCFIAEIDPREQPILVIVLERLFNLTNPNSYYDTVNKIVDSSVSTSAETINII